ncbi:MAG: GNAT family N-acetyltransferase [Bacteroidales bacterium]|jgi:predicted acetyltransferase|nr:GNAT family N-acetyltransferase [Bacteroidales bacterium]
MKYKIVQLTKSDYDEAIDLSNMIFSMNAGPHDFPSMIPSVYKDTEEHMNSFYAIKDKGKIRSMLGIFPSNMIVNGTKLKLAQIGGVCTHPYSKEKGMMTSLMTFAVEKMKKDSVDIALLGGQRDRYKYFNFDDCGVEYEYTLSTQSFKHNKIDSDKLKLELCKKNDLKIMKTLNSLYKKQDVYVDRKDENFFDICHDFHSDLYIGKIDNKIVGYLVVDKRKSFITEVNAIKDDIIIMMINALNNISFSSKRIRTSDINLSRKLDKIVEGRKIDASGNWQVFNLEKIITAFLILKNETIKLPFGKVVLDVKEYGTLQIIISEKEIICKKINAKTKNSFEITEFHRIVFGPVSPIYVTDIPEELNIFNLWFPLPLCISTQDHL